MGRSLQRQIARQQKFADYRYRKGVQGHLLREMGADATIADCHPDIRTMFQLVAETVTAFRFGHPVDCERATRALSDFYKKFETAEKEPLTEPAATDTVPA